MINIVFEIGDSLTRVGVVDQGELKNSTSFATAKPEVTLQKIKKVVQDDFKVKSVEAVCGGVRGQLDDERSGIYRDSHLSDWIGVSIVANLETAFAAPVHLENDTALAGLGEAVYGAGKDFDFVVYHTIDNGVGGVKIEHKQIDEASVGFEPGHQVLDIDRTVLGENISPTLENLVSGKAVENRLGIPVAEVAQGDVLWNTLAGYLGQGLRNSVLYWSPEIIVLGGGMITGTPHIPIEQIRQQTVAALDEFTECPFITKGELGDLAGLHGAMAWLESSSSKE